MMTSEPEDRACEQCGAPLDRHILEGLCSRCLARYSLMEMAGSSEIEDGKSELEGQGKQTLEDGEGPQDDGTMGPVDPRADVEGQEAEIPKARFGDYELLEEIAHGGMGVVYRARQVSLKRIVAVKMLLCGQYAGKAALERFRAEAETVARLQHPNIVAIHAIGETDGQPYFSMDYVAGQNLAEVVRDRPLPPPKAAAYLRKTALAVQYAHTQGVLHRDLKPANVLIDETDEPRVTDFGLARRLAGDSELTLTGQVVGSPSFMPPEQGAGKKAKLGPTADIYGLGALLYYLITARPPFVGETFEATLAQVLNTEPVSPRQLNPALPRDLETICLKCLEKDPSRRYANAQELADELDRFLRKEPIRARPLGPLGKTWRWCRRKPALAGVMAAALVVVLAVSSIAIWRVERARAQEALERYAANISLAHNSIREGSTDLAFERLLQCPEQNRNWEWGHLLFECLQEVSTISTYPSEPQWIQTPFLQRFDLSADGNRLGSLNRDGILSMWDLLEEREMFRFGDQTNRVVSYAFRAGTNELAVARMDGSLVVLDTSTGTQRWSIKKPVLAASNHLDAPVIALNSDIHGETQVRDLLHHRPWMIASVEWGGDRLLTRSVDGRVTVRDYAGAGGEWHWPPAGTSLKAGQAWFSTRFSNVVVQTATSVLLLNAATGEAMENLGWDSAAASAIASPDGRRVVVIEPQGQAKLIGLKGFVKDLGRLVARNMNAPLDAFFDAQGTLLCTTGDRGTARVFRTETGEQLFALPDSVYGGAFSHKGDQLAVFGQGRIVRIWDVRRGQELRQLRGHLSSVVQVAHNPRQQRWVTASRNGVVKTWSTRSAGKVYWADNVATTSGISPDGKWLAIGRLFEGLRLYEADTGRLIWERLSRTFTVIGFAFAPDNRLLYAAGSDRCVRIFNVADGTLAGMLRGHSYPTFPVHCSPDGNYVATGDSGGMIKVWDARTRAQKLSVAAYKGMPQSLMFDSRSRYLLAAGPGNPMVWEVATGRLVVELGTNCIAGWSAAFFPDGRQVVTVGLDHMVRIWEIPSGRLLSSWKGQTQGNFAVSFTPDGLRFASMGADMSTLGQSLPKLEIWDAQHGRLILSFEPHRESMWAALFDSTGRNLVTSSMDETVRLWESFPWKDADYQGPPGATFAERVRLYAREYWRRQVTASTAAPGSPPVAAPSVLPLGIPEWERERWLQRDPALGPEQINLDKSYTGVLDAILFPFGNEMEWDNDLSELPTGRQRFGGVLFDVRGAVCLNSDPANYFARRLFTNRVDGIAVRRDFRKLHVLHAAVGQRDAKGYSTRPDRQDEGLLIGSYIVNYADGKQHEFEIRYGRDLRNWWWGGHGDPEAEIDRGKVAWVGTNGTSRRYDARVRLFMSTFENPRPETEVASIDFVSKTPLYAPFLVAMTVEP